MGYYNLISPSKLGYGIFTELSILITNDDGFLNYVKNIANNNQKVQFDQRWNLLQKKNYKHLTRKELFNRYSYGDQNHRNLPKLPQSTFVWEKLLEYLLNSFTS